MRNVKYYEPAERRYLDKNLQCTQCGNTDNFYIDLKLYYLLEPTIGELKMSLSTTAERIFANLAKKIERLVDHLNPVVFCANCQDGFVDLQDRLLEDCWLRGCPGCFICGNFISQQELIDLCSDCLIENEGNVSEEDCFNFCPYYDEGLSEVRDHYGLTLDDIKREVGF